MSWWVANTCAERKFGSATRKQIIMFLADKASDDGSGIRCSKGTIQRHTELGETTVKRTDLAKVEAMEPTAEPKIETGSTVAGLPGPPRPPNHSKTTHKPPTRMREAVADEEAEKVLAAYPSDRLRGKTVCLAQVEEASNEGMGRVIIFSECGLKRQPVSISERKQGHSFERPCSIKSVLMSSNAVRLLSFGVRRIRPSPLDLQAKETLMMAMEPRLHLV